MMEQVLLLPQEIKEKQKPSGAWPRKMGSLGKGAPVQDRASGPSAEIQTHYSDLLYPKRKIEESKRVCYPDKKIHATFSSDDEEITS